MSFGKLILSSTAAIFLVAVNDPARAASITETIDFTATGFIQFPGPPSPLSGAPVDPVSGSFTLTFDPTQVYLATNSNIEQNYLNLYTGSPDFTYMPVDSEGMLSIYSGTFGGGPAFRIDLLSAAIYRGSGNGDSADLEVRYTTGSDNGFFSTAGTYTVSSVPLPGAAVLFGSGLITFMGFGGTGIRKRGRSRYLE